jgi:hypothetical protein
MGPRLIGSARSPAQYVGRMAGAIKRFAVVLGAALAGCGGLAADERPPPRPTAKDVERLVAQTRMPAYWFGPAIREHQLSAIYDDQPGRLGFAYGAFSCDRGSGCIPLGTVTTARRDFSGLLPGELSGPDCWSRLQRAVVLLYGCDPHGYPQEIDILTARLAISVSGIEDENEQPAVRDARRLRPVNDRAPWPLEPPDPLSCRELRAFPRRHRDDIPKVLRPKRRC